MKINDMKKLEFNVNETVTFRPYFKSYKCRVVHHALELLLLSDTETEQRYYLEGIDCPVKTNTSPRNIVESTHFMEYEGESKLEKNRYEVSCIHER